MSIEVGQRYRPTDSATKCIKNIIKDRLYIIIEIIKDMDGIKGYYKNDLDIKNWHYEQRWENKQYFELVENILTGSEVNDPENIYHANDKVIYFIKNGNHPLAKHEVKAHICGDIWVMGKVNIVIDEDYFPWSYEGCSKGQLKVVDFSDIKLDISNAKQSDKVYDFGKYPVFDYDTTLWDKLRVGGLYINKENRLIYKIIKIVNNGNADTYINLLCMSKPSEGSYLKISIQEIQKFDKEYKRLPNKGEKVKVNGKVKTFDRLILKTEGYINNTMKFDDNSVWILDYNNCPVNVDGLAWEIVKEDNNQTERDKAITKWWEVCSLYDKGLISTVSYMEQQREFFKIVELDYDEEQKNLKEELKDINPKYKVWDKVRIIKKVSNSHSFNIGDICEVREVLGNIKMYGKNKYNLQKQIGDRIVAQIVGAEDFELVEKNIYTVDRDIKFISHGVCEMDHKNKEIVDVTDKLQWVRDLEIGDKIMNKTDNSIYSITEKTDKTIFHSGQRHPGCGYFDYEELDRIFNLYEKVNKIPKWVRDLKVGDKIKWKDAISDTCRVQKNENDEIDIMTWMGTMKFESEFIGEKAELCEKADTSSVLSTLVLKDRHCGHESYTMPIDQTYQVTKDVWKNMPIPYGIAEGISSRVNDNPYCVELKPDVWIFPLSKRQRWGLKEVKQSKASEVLYGRK